MLNFENNFKIYNGVLYDLTPYRERESDDSIVVKLPTINDYLGLTFGDYENKIYSILLQFNYQFINLKSFRIFSEPYEIVKEYLDFISCDYQVSRPNKLPNVFIEILYTYNSDQFVLYRIVELEETINKIKNNEFYHYTKFYEFDKKKFIYKLNKNMIDRLNLRTQNKDTIKEIDRIINIINLSETKRIIK